LAAKYASRSEIGSWSPDQLAYLIFNDSVSSKDDVSDISGRGIGMSAVKKMIEDVHGNIRIELGEADQDQFTPFVLVIELPWAPGILGQYQATG
jgi:chemotaxis protein histidine kinase CheA